jgi:hypothetical protein
MADLKSLLGDKYKEGMTIEELMALEVEEPKADTTAYDNLKKRFDEVASEAANYKKQLRANMTEAEQKAAADAEEIARVLEENKQLKSEKAIAENAKGLVAIGYDEKLATEVATALFNGDAETVIKAQAKFVDAQKKAVLAEDVKATPAPPVDNGGAKTLTKEEFAKLSLAEQTKIYTDTPELYKELTKQ